jgi:hypothetical protein
MTSTDLTNWLKTYGQAWETRNPDAAAALFTEDAAYYETPFGSPLDGIFLLDFDETGLCRELREWWHRVELPQEQ